MNEQLTKAIQAALREQGAKVERFKRERAAAWPDARLLDQEAMNAAVRREETILEGMQRMADVIREATR